MRVVHAFMLLALAVATEPAVAQHKGSGSGAGSGSGSGSASHAAYAGLQQREIKSLSDDDIKGLRDGRGMGFALPAELNGYPGPMHILELAKELGLSEEQRGAVQAIFDRMKARARAAGSSYVEAERALDQAFKSGKADAETIARLAREADQRRAEKRLAHLDAHLEAAPVLTPEQRAKYSELRGTAAPKRTP